MMKSKFAAGAAGVAIVAAALGGSTFALWNTSANADGLAINSGVLDLTHEPQTVEDVSTADGTAPAAYAAGTAIDPATFKVVPGDTLAAVDVYGIEAVGDNLTFDAKVTAPAALATGDLAAGTDVNYVVTDSKGAVLASSGWVDAKTGTVPLTNIDLDPTSVGSGLKLVTMVNFDKATSGVDLQDKAASVTGATLTLEQTR